MDEKQLGIWIFRSVVIAKLLFRYRQLKYVTLGSQIYGYAFNGPVKYSHGTQEFILIEGVKVNFLAVQCKDCNVKLIP